MRRGDFPAAWRVADAVLAGRDPHMRDDPALPYHLRWVWDGRAVDGRDVLVRCYHGLGDTLNFCRYLAPLRQRARSVTLEAQPALLPLLAALPGVDCAAPFDVAHPLPPAQVDVEIMELPHVLRLGIVPPCKLPLPLGEGRGEGPSDRYTALCWESGAWESARSVPLADLLQAAGSPPFLSLQRGPAAAQAAAPCFINPADDDSDILRTAFLILAARRVVTVDTMVAHLAGCLGAPTRLLLKHDPDWRWQAGEGTCPWYPSVTMVRQTVPGDWSHPLARVAAVA